MALCRFIYGVIKTFLCNKRVVHVHYVAIDDLAITTGPFQRHVCDQEKWKILLLNGYSSWYKHAINKFLIDNSASSRVKTYRSLKIKFFVKVKNKVHVTIGHVCDFARNYGPAQNDFKVKILCVMEFLLSNAQMTDNILTNNFIYFV